MAQVLVTGASSGLGLLTATSLADAGHDVVLHARAPDRIEDAAVLDRMHGFVAGDLADPDDVRRVAEQANGFGTFDAVIHNAGVDDGPALIAVNLLAPYALTALMERPARTIVLSSSLHRSGTPRGAGRTITGGAHAGYGDTKLWVIALFLGLPRRWPGVQAHAVDPGWVPTRMGGPHAPDDLTEGHRTQEWLATAPAQDIEPRTGGYWHHRAAHRPHAAALDASFQDEVVAALEQRTGITLPRA